MVLSEWEIASWFFKNTLPGKQEGWTVRLDPIGINPVPLFPVPLFPASWLLHLPIQVRMVGGIEEQSAMAISEDLERIARQERELILPRLDAETAWELGLKLRALAVERGLAVVIDVRRFGQPLFYAALEGTTPSNPDWVRRKSNVTARFHCSSYAVGLNLKRKNESLAESAGLPVADYATHGGCFPLRVASAGAVGSVCVSGLPQRADHELAVEALCALLGRDYNELKLGPEEA